VIRRLYIENFRCFGQFNLEVEDLNTILLVGKNGSGKSTIRDGLFAIRELASGKSRIGDLLSPSELSWFSKKPGMGFFLESMIRGERFQYELQLELPEGFREFRVSNEYLIAGEKNIFSRHLAEVTLTRKSGVQSTFPVDWHQLALPFIQETGPDDPLSIFRSWLSRMLIIAPVPQLIDGESRGESRKLSRDCHDFADWYRGLSVEYPTAGARVHELLHKTWPDLQRMINSQVGTESRSLEFTFKEAAASAPAVPFAKLSDGEKCLVIHAAVLAWAEATEGAICFWDEPDNYVSLDEMTEFILTLRQKLSEGRQLFATSHNPEAIRTFTRENTFVLNRSSHLMATRPPVRATDLDLPGDLATSLARGEALSQS